jgi:hypothetical protein
MPQVERLVEKVLQKEFSHRPQRRYPSEIQ